MFAADQVEFHVIEGDGDVLVVSIVTPAGGIEVIGRSWVDRGILYFTEAHIQGLFPGALSRCGLNAIGRKLMSEADVTEIVIEGGTRTTGRRQGFRPRTIRFPRD